MLMKNYYSMFHLPLNASENKIKVSYRKLAKAFHPDICKDPKAEIVMREINRIFGILLDSKKKAIYDRSIEFGHFHVIPQNNVPEKPNRKKKYIIEDGWVRYSFGT